MNRIFLIMLMLLIIGCSAGGGGGGGSIPTGPSGHAVSFLSGTSSATSNYVKMEQTVVSGDTVTIAVKAVNIVEPVGGLAIDVTYNSASLDFVSASNGDVINGNTASFVANGSGGRVIVTVTDVPDSSPTSNGTIFTMTFKGTASGNCDIGFQNNSLFNATGNTIPGIVWSGGTVSVQ